MIPEASKTALIFVSLFIIFPLSLWIEKCVAMSQTTYELLI
ncbi:hypothetical protein UF68_2059 [Staphylococcus warneri]|nr:hypothetical protein AQ02_0229 [Staphylococcus warneri Lyso 1 2011]KEK58753.1 hypothetical protein AQ03_2315 [Staphylococcus warneri Lyso 2 2011]KKI60868.1 hypothetical protein UF68_2059 [Staphylococcus warneri]